MIEILRKYNKFLINWRITNKFTRNLPNIMSASYVDRLIREGSYTEAKYQASTLNTLDNLYYQSRIAELTGNFELSLKHADEGLELVKTEEETLKFTIAKSYALWRLFRFETAEILLGKVVSTVEEMEYDINPLRGTYFNIVGLIYWKQNQLEEAFNYFEKALISRKEVGDPSPISYTLNNLGNTYLEHRDFPQAKDYYEQSYKMRTSLGHKPAVAASHNSFGRYSDAIGEHNAAKSHHKSCLQLWEEVENQQFIAKSHRFLAINAFYRGDIESNHIHWMQSDQIFMSLDNQTDYNTNLRLKDKFSLYTE